YRFHQRKQAQGLFHGCRQLRGGQGNQRRFVLQHLGNASGGLLRIIPFFLLQVLADRRNGLRGVTRIGSRGVELVLIPEAPRKALGRGQLALALNQQLVYFLQRSACQRGAAVRTRTIECLLVVRSAARKGFHGVVQRCKIQMRRQLLLSGGNRGFSRVGSGFKEALLNFLIPLLHFLPLVVGKFLHFADVHLDVIGKVRELERQQVRIGHAQDGGAAGLAERAA